MGLASVLPLLAAAVLSAIIVVAAVVLVTLAGQVRTIVHVIVAADSGRRSVAGAFKCFASRVSRPSALTMPRERFQIPNPHTLHH